MPVLPTRSAGSGCRNMRIRGRLADMPERPDYSALVAGQTSVLDRFNAGVSGLGALFDLVLLGQTALAGVGASFAEYGP